eukprot:6986431-Pyramimonas_sp.AAC.1
MRFGLAERGRRGTSSTPEALGVGARILSRTANTLAPAGSARRRAPVVLLQSAALPARGSHAA